ncbi:MULTISPECIES: hypothetical protein [Caproicibacterium]|uniref:Uncharacterized protein n=1 Tax=Caproicibacterium lactatifermentans TaxID=2666138 RepID=A0A859DV23_9FIRM|nr:hypothetical protein [Caproicibacterium lactatifermentans]QKN23881.1 hypothetical protein GJQ69_04945 [Caproicibacterium lactatifermentans]QKO31049.1 hypothetical protein GKP14_08605 [Caproicibacterium lactatifermentans]
MQNDVNQNKSSEKPQLPIYLQEAVYQTALSEKTDEEIQKFVQTFTQQEKQKPENT